MGSRLGPYEILAPIGAGGMGEVFRARDTNLGRDVAIKVLPDLFARDTARMARFGREAKLLAALDHSNIASIYGLETSGDTRALVMQLAEGPTLADRIAQGPIPIEDAMHIAKQIADALEYAHEHGIIHRDLKPANIKVAADDTVKILDFGLAKALESELSAAEIANSPTISRMATQAGVLLGTAAYMSPEQAKAKPVDRRADIWAFGCVLYEMLTGKKAFHGETVTDTLAAVLKNEPDWSQLPSATPMRVRVLLQRCLQKDPKQRLRDIGDARISLDEALSGAPEATLALATESAGKPWRAWFAYGVSGVFVLIAASFAFLYFHQTQPAGQVTSFEIPAPESTTVSQGLALSPDGRKLAFSASTNGQSRLWVRSLATLESRPLDGSEGASGVAWSSDSRYLAFTVEGKLKKMEASGGPPVTICDATEVVGGDWNRDDKIIFGTAVGVFQVSASGGSPSPVTTGGVAIFPRFLPDGRHFLYWGLPGIYVGSLDAKPQEQRSRPLVPDSSMGVYAPSSNSAVGYLLFVRGAGAFGTIGTLMAQRFDPKKLELTGEAVPIAERISNISFSTSTTNVLAYVTGAGSAVPQEAPGFVQGQLTWFDRGGKVLGAVGDPGIYRSLALSPDGKRVAFNRVDPQNAGTRNIWLYDFARGTTTRFTFDSSWDDIPVWSPDGSHIAFGSQREGVFQLYQKTSNMAGEDELLYKSDAQKVPSGWSPDGRSFLYFTLTSPNQGWSFPLGGAAADRKPALIEDSKFNIGYGRFSPDGRWIAYTSDESGKNQIYVRPFDASAATGSSPAGGTAIAGKWMVSKDGGINPLWRRDGKELFYLSLDGQMMAVDVSTSGIFQVGVPKALFKVPRGVLFFDVSADGKRFLMASPSASNPAIAQAPQPPFTVVLNWQAALKKQ